MSGTAARRSAAANLRYPFVDIHTEFAPSFLRGARTQTDAVGSVAEPRALTVLPFEQR